MPTRRLFDEDSGRFEFEGRIAAIREIDGLPWIALDATAFFPEEGGQRPDRGVLDGVPVVHVAIDDAGTIWHRLERALAGPVGASAAGQVDPLARRDHSQHHTGQHALSRAFVEILGAETRSFHMGEDVSTIDLDAAGGEIDPAAIRDVEARANAIVFDDRPVVTFEEPRPDDRPLRRVIIEGFDEQHCCGTHVRRTGELGLVKTLRMERIRSLTRVQFVCGRLALRAFQDILESVDAASRALSAGWSDLPGLVAGLIEEAKEGKWRSRDWQERWAILEAGRLARETPRAPDGALRIAAWIDGADAASLRAAANAIIAQGRAVAVLVGPGESGKRLWVVARSEELPAGGDLDAREKLEAILSTLGGRGGGTKLFAQGVCAADEGACRARLTTSAG